MKKKIEYFHGKNQLWIHDVIPDEELMTYIISKSLPNDCAVGWSKLGDAMVTDVGTLKSLFKELMIKSNSVN